MQSAEPANQVTSMKPFYETVLKAKLAEAMQVLVKRMPAIKATVTECLMIDDATVTAEALGQATRSLLRPSSDPVLFRPDFLGIVGAGACSTTTGSVSSSSPARPSPSTSRNAGAP